MKTSIIIQALMASAFQAQLSIAAAVTTTTPVAANAALIGGCAGVAPADELQCYKDQCPQPTNGLLGSSCASYPPPNQLACYKSKCPNLGAQSTTNQALVQPTPQALIGGCSGVAPQNELQCYKDHCPEPATGLLGSSCSTLFPESNQLACYKRKCPNLAALATTPTTTTANLALQSSANAAAGKDCAGIAPEYKLECFHRQCPMPGPPGFSCASLSPQYQIDCYEKRCHEVAPGYETALQTPNVVQQTSNAATQQSPNPGQQTTTQVGGCAGVAPEYQLECYRENCPMPGPPGFSCGSWPPPYQLDCYKKRCNEVAPGYGPEAVLATITAVPAIIPTGPGPVIPTKPLVPTEPGPVIPTASPNGLSGASSLIGGCETVTPDQREACYERECFKLFCAWLPAQYQLKCFRDNCSATQI